MGMHMQYSTEQTPQQPTFSLPFAIPTARMQSTNSPDRTIARGLAIAIVDSPPPMLHICVPSTSQGVWKRQQHHHSRRSWAKHITCKDILPQQSLSFPVGFECVDWGWTIMTCMQQRRRRRRSLVVLDSDACKEATRFCDAQYFHSVMEDYSDMEKPSFERQLPSSDTFGDTTELTLKELAGVVLQLSFIQTSQD